MTVWLTRNSNLKKITCIQKHTIQIWSILHWYLIILFVNIWSLRASSGHILTSPQMSPLEVMMTGSYILYFLFHRLYIYNTSNKDGRVMFTIPRCQTYKLMVKLFSWRKFTTVFSKDFLSMTVFLKFQN